MTPGSYRSAARMRRSSIAHEVPPRLETPHGPSGHRPLYRHTRHWLPITPITDSAVAAHFAMLFYLVGCAIRIATRPRRRIFLYFFLSTVSPASYYLLKFCVELDSVGSAG